MSYATKEQLAELAAYMASQINVPTIGIGGGYAPIGTIISYMGTTAPQDYLACDGSAKNIADYPQLANFFEAQFGSKNYFGGDGTTTFNVPDLRGEFLRGTGTNSHTNQGKGANVGIHQDGTEHWNTLLWTENTSTNNASMVNYITSTESGVISNANKDSLGPSYSNGKQITFSGTKSSLNSVTKCFTSRPTNTSILYCIKAVAAGEVYSTEERVVGTWIDGKPLYQRTLVKTGGVADGTMYFQNEISDVDIILKKDVLFRTTIGNGSLESEFACSSTDHLQTIVTNTTENGCYVYTIIGNTRIVTEIYVTVQYTKTTD